MEANKSLEVLFAPAEFGVLGRRDLSQTVCVVFDILRATSTMTTALGNGAAAIFPVAEIAEALAIRAERPDILLAGERRGLRIRGSQTGGPEFDLGNSPREFLPEKVANKMIVMTTTNGTRALQACAGAQQVLTGAFLNLGATHRWIEAVKPRHLLLVCAGTADQVAYEDAVAAGALCDLVWPTYGTELVADSAEIARELFGARQRDLLGALQHSRNGRRLMADPELRDDVGVCAQLDTHGFAAGLRPDGTVAKLGEPRTPAV